MEYAKRIFYELKPRPETTCIGGQLVVAHLLHGQGCAGLVHVQAGFK
jgi:hypothetical protein